MATLLIIAPPMLAPSAPLFPHPFLSMETERSLRLCSSEQLIWLETNKNNMGEWPSSSCSDCLFQGHRIFTAHVRSCIRSLGRTQQASFHDWARKRTLLFQLSFASFVVFQFFLDVFLHSINAGGLYYWKDWIWQGNRLYKGLLVHWQRFTFSARCFNTHLI